MLKNNGCNGHALRKWIYSDCPLLWVMLNAHDTLRREPNNNLFLGQQVSRKLCMSAVCFFSSQSQEAKIT